METLPKVAFTGHRNGFCSPAELENIAALYPGSVWVHGGAQGFDSQVQEYAAAHGIETLVIRPDYSHGKAAPLIRNRQIVDSASVLVACFDGRSAGGTAYTVKYAQKKSVPVQILRPA